MERVIDRFKSDIANHELEVVVEDGVNRIIKFKDKDGSSVHHFYVMQTHGKLCFSGDMGDFVFRNHNADMLAWFYDNTSLSYIKEKCQAGRTSEYSDQAARESLKCQVEGFCADYLDEHLLCSDEADDIDLDKARSDWIESLYGEVISEINFENEFTLHESVSDVSIEISDGLSFEIDTSEGVNCRKPTYQFLWCVLAMNKVAELYFDTDKKAARDYKDASDLVALRSKVAVQASEIVNLRRSIAGACEILDKEIFDD